VAGGSRRPAGCCCLQGVSEVSRFSCMKFLSVSGVYDYAEPDGNLRLRLPSVLPSAYMDSVGALKNIFEAQYPAPPIPPVYASPAGLATSNAKLGARMDRFSPFL